MKERVFSGIQPTGTPHLGNYLGAIAQWEKLQKTHDCHFCLVDLHAITMPWEAETLRENILQSAACLLACGIEPGKLYVQSSLHAHARLGWLFNCVVRLGWLNRMTQFKDKAGKNREKHSAGLYTYPSLMAADILTFKATRIPVGDDQRQHIELANDIAQKFNHDLGKEYKEKTGRDFFPTIEALIPAQAARVMSLRDGTKKMSKSDPSDQSRILLTDSADLIATKIKKAKTDPHPIPETVAELTERPEAKNLLSLYTVLDKDGSLEKTLNAFSGKGFGDFKSALADLMVEKLAPISNKTNELLSDKEELRKTLKLGAEEARKVAEPIVSEAEALAGLGF
ncbi:tryptophan--tRNA ligase [Acetobacteraceae bacterium]|nr:tryptophan--tRNA ligase [Acetobacteraceae bacterium]